MQDNGEFIELPKLSNDLINNYNQLLYAYNDKIPIGFENYLDYSVQDLSQIFGIELLVVKKYLMIIKLKNLVEDFQETIELIAMEPELISSDLDLEARIQSISDSIEYLTNEEENTTRNSMVNYIVFPDMENLSFDEMRKKLYLNNPGYGIISENKVKTSFNTLRNISYNSKELSPKIHKLMGRVKDHALRLTTENIIFERYSNAKKTKVIFCKLPITSDIRDRIKKHYNNNNFENIYFVTGFGTINDSGYDEYDLYKIFQSDCYSCEDYLQNLVNILIDSNNVELAVKKLIEYIDNSNIQISQLGMDPEYKNNLRK